MTNLIQMLSAGLLLSALTSCAVAQESDGTAQLAHTRTAFDFTVNAPLEQAAPLFGADKERVWAPGWNPQFLYPNPAHDQQGMVFQVSTVNERVRG